MRTLFPFPLALNREGRISTVTPGCQTFVTVVDSAGNVLRDDEVLHFRGRRQLRFAPFFGHNLGTRAIGCAVCHGDPTFLGFGQHVVEDGVPQPTLLCEKNPHRALDGFLAAEGDSIAAYSAVSRPGGRPLAEGEIRSVWRVNLCLICHDKAADPIYRRPLDFGALGDSLHTALLSGGWEAGGRNTDAPLRPRP